MSRNPLLRFVVTSVHVTAIVTMMLVAREATAVDVHIGPRMWYAIQNINLGLTAQIMDRDVQTVTHLDQAETPLIGFSVLVESKLDLIGSFFWGQSTSEFIFASRIGQTPASYSVIQSFGKLEVNAYDVEILVRWRPKYRQIYLVTGLRYYHFEQILKSKATIQIPPTDLAVFFPPGTSLPPGTNTNLNSFPNQNFTQDLFLWEIGGGLYTSITKDAKHRLIAGALIGLGYSHNTQKGKGERFFADPILPNVSYSAVDIVDDTFALGWDLNVGYQWQFHSKLNLVARYRAFGKTGTAGDSDKLIFRVSHGPEIGVGYSF